MLVLPRLNEGQTVDQYLGDLIRRTLDNYASNWEMEAKQATDADLTGPPIENAQALIAYVRNPAITLYNVPAYTVPVPPGPPPL